MERTLPKGWKMVRLGEVCEHKTEKRNPSEIKDGSFEYVDIASIDSVAGIIRAVRVIANTDAPSRARKVIRSNDVIVSTVRPNLNAVAIVSDSLDNQICSTGFCVLRARPHIIKYQYIFALTRSKNFVETLTKKTQGASYPAVSDKDIFNFAIPLPPLSTQEKIVEILEEADGLRKLRKEADEKMKDLIPSLFVKMFGDPATNPKGWEVKKLGEVCDIKSGGTPRRQKKEYWDGDIPWLGSTVCKDTVACSAKEFITKIGLEKSAAKIFKPKTTLIALVGATIGKTAFLTFEATTNQNIAGLYPLDLDCLIPEFVFYFSQTLYPEFIKLGEEKFRMANLSFIRNLTILIPPLPLQQEFAARVEEIEAEKARQAESKAKLDDLFNSLMQKAFAGELVA